VVPRSLIAVAALVAVLLASPAPAAAQRDVPQSFYGVNYDADIALRATPQVQDGEWDLQARSGVETTRVVFSWNRTQPGQNSPPNFAETDAMVARAVRGGIDLLPVVIEAPEWAREDLVAYHSPPEHPQDMATYLVRLIERYGEKGTFWTQHPELPKRAIRNWQIWNEPHMRFQWDSRKPWAPAYGRLLRVVYKAVKRADPGAKVVLAGMSNASWTFLAEAYKKGRIRGYYDVAALHPYTRKASGVITISRRFRTIMKRNRDGRKQLWITELGLPASKGKRDSRSLLQTTDEGMADFLTTSMEKIIAYRRSRNVRVSRVYWYSWASTYTDDIFRFTGLREYDPRNQTLRDKPAYAAFVESARRHQACVKNSSGACQ
jgi:hypothetical protein